MKYEKLLKLTMSTEEIEKILNKYVKDPVDRTKGIYHLVRILETSMEIDSEQSEHGEHRTK